MEDFWTRRSQIVSFQNSRASPSAKLSGQLSSASYSTKGEPVCAHYTTRFSSTEAANCRENTPSRAQQLSIGHHQIANFKLRLPDPRPRSIPSGTSSSLTVDELYSCPPGALAKQRPVFQQHRYLCYSAGPWLWGDTENCSRKFLSNFTLVSALVKLLGATFSLEAMSTSLTPMRQTE